MRPLAFVTACLTALALVPAAAPARAQEAPDVRPPLVDTRSESPPTPEVAARIAQLEHRLHAAQGRAAGYAALTLGGTALIAGGIVALVVIGVVDVPACMGDGCVRPIEDFAAGISLAALGVVAVLIGGILWGDADAEARTLTRRIDELRYPIEPTFSLGPDGGRAGLRVRF